MTGVTRKTSRIAALLAPLLAASSVTAGSTAAATADRDDSSITQVKPT